MPPPVDVHPSWVEADAKASEKLQEDGLLEEFEATINTPGVHPRPEVVQAYLQAWVAGMSEPRQEESIHPNPPIFTYGDGVRFVQDGPGRCRAVRTRSWLDRLLGRRRDDA